MRVLLATDGSEDAALAARAVTEISGGIDAELHIEESGGRVAETHTKRGPTVDEILDLAQELRVGLITLGSRGLGPLKNLVLGSGSRQGGRDAAKEVSP